LEGGRVRGGQAAQNESGNHCVYEAGTDHQSEESAEGVRGEPEGVGLVRRIDQRRCAQNGLRNSCGLGDQIPKGA